ncbi:hypothetical protein Tco_0469669 [Tanacetum coccineum]
MMLEVTRYEFLLNVSVHAVLGDVFRRNMKSRPCHEFRGRDMMQDHLRMEKKQQVHNKDPWCGMVQRKSELRRFCFIQGGDTSQLQGKLWLYDEVRTRTLFVLSSSNRGRLLGIIDLMRQKNKRMKQKDQNRH